MTSILIQTDVGDAIIIRGTLTDEAGDPVEGANVTAQALAPGATEATDLGAATDEGEGVYSVTLEPSAPGRLDVRMESAAPHKAAAEGVVYVRETRFV